MKCPHCDEELVVLTSPPPVPQWAEAAINELATLAEDINNGIGWRECANRLQSIHVDVMELGHTAETNGTS